MANAREIYRAHPTQEEIDEVLVQRVAAALGTVNDDGSVHLAYVIFVFEDGRFLFETASVTTKARNIASRGQASVLVQGRAATGRSLMVEAEGTARIIECPDADRVNRRIREKYIIADAMPALDEAWSRFDDVAIELTPTRWRSWTGSLLEESTEASLGRPYEEIWKPD